MQEIRGTRAIDANVKGHIEEQNKRVRREMHACEENDEREKGSLAGRKYGYVM